MSIENLWTKSSEFEDEISSIELRRRANGSICDDITENLVGLAISGGGIRSATFGLGVLEGLKGLGILAKIDYLSTVSGGGYIGAWLTANCKRSVERKAKLENGDEFANRSDATGAYRKASEDWLQKSADWDLSIAHLRRYSNYLSPQLGFFSADTWCMAAIWIRNTLLVQVTVILAIAAILLAPRLLFDTFKDWSQAGNWRWLTVVLFVLAVAGIAGNQWRLIKNGNVPFLTPEHWGRSLVSMLLCVFIAGFLGWKNNFHPFANAQVNWVVAAPIALLIVFAGFCILPTGLKLIGTIGIKQRVWTPITIPRRINYGQGWVQVLVVTPLLITGFLVAAVLWGQTAGEHALPELKALNSFSEFFTNAWRYWPFPLFIAFASLWLLSFGSRRDDKIGFITAWLAPIPAALALYSLLCAIMLMMHRLGSPKDPQYAPEGLWYAFVWAPTLVLYAFALAIVALIGFMGRQSIEGVREWWGRLGAWLWLYGFTWTLITAAAIYGPKIGTAILDSGTWQGKSAIGGWLVTTLGGLFAGNSAKTESTKKNNEADGKIVAKILNLIAVVAPFIFVAGLIIGVSTCLHFIILNASGQSCCEIASVHTQYWTDLTNSTPGATPYVLAVVLACLIGFAARVDINEFSLNAFYRNRLSRCYLGATRFIPGERTPQNFTQFDDNDDLPMSALGFSNDKELKQPPGPVHILNCALNLGGSSDLALHTRHSASFTMTPYIVGSSYPSKEPSGERKPLGYQKVDVYGGLNSEPTLAQAISVSGAAASPNMGYHTSPVVAFLLTIFNARLGWWFPNPNHSDIKSPSPAFSLRYLVKELFGGADDKSDYLMISDGGHFENLGAYELIRRRCRVIIVSDAECDPELKFEGLGSLIRMCNVDFGIKIDINVNAIRLTNDSNWSNLRHAVGTIDYGTGFPPGILIYLKASMTGNENSAVLQYKVSHGTFPHESTSNQFYGEDQFESYRSLGSEITALALGSVSCEQDFVNIAQNLHANFTTNQNQ